MNHVPSSVPPHALSRRILFTSGYYPPYAPAGAVRMPKLAKFWLGAGHDVRIIAIRNPALAGTLAADSADLQVAHLPFALPSLLSSWQRPAAAPEVQPAVAATERKADSSVRRLLRSYYYQALLTPDRYRSWVQLAVEHGLALARDWRPGVIYSSRLPRPVREDRHVHFRWAVTVGCWLPGVDNVTHGRRGSAVDLGGNG